MNKIHNILTARNTFFIAHIFIAAALVLLTPKAAVNVDEQLHYPHAKKVVNWYFTLGKDQSCLHTGQTNLKYYGQSVDNFTALFNRLFNVNKEFLVRHYTGAFFFWLLLLFSGLLVRSLTGSWGMAVFSILALVFMPRLSGQAFGNLKDIPFAAGYMAGLLMIIRFLKEFPCPSWKAAILLGLAIAFTVSVRVGGLILFPFLGLGILILFVLKPFYLKKIISNRKVCMKLIGQGAVVFIIGYFAGLLFWPYALQNILIHPLESLRVMEHYKVSIRQVFEGGFIWSTRLPWYYLPKWILISTPLSVLTGFLFFLGHFVYQTILRKRFNRELFFEGFVLFAFAFPFFYVIAIGSNLYSGVRQMLFIMPPMALLAVIGGVRLVKFVEGKSKKMAFGISAFLIILLVWPLKHQFATFPADYVFFNILAGGNRKAWSNYEYDYYFHSLKEPVEYLIDLANDEKVTVAMNCNLSNYFEDHPNIKYQYTRFLERSSYDWDYCLLGVNYLHPHLLKNNLWQPAGIIKIFYHKGNPAAVLVKRMDKSDFFGISEIKNGNLSEGTELLESALEKEPNNVWLYVNLARAKLDAGDITGFRQYVEKGKKIYPFYEPFLLLEATCLFKEGKCRESLQKLKILFEINPRYLPAKKLLDETSHDCKITQEYN